MGRVWFGTGRAKTPPFSVNLKLKYLLPHLSQSLDLTPLGLYSRFSLLYSLFLTSSIAGELGLCSLSLLCSLLSVSTRRVSLLCSPSVSALGKRKGICSALLYFFLLQLRSWLSLSLTFSFYSFSFLFFSFFLYYSFSVLMAICWFGWWNLGKLWFLCYIKVAIVNVNTYCIYFLNVGL